MVVKKFRTVKHAANLSITELLTNGKTELAGTWQATDKFANMEMLVLRNYFFTIKYIDWCKSCLVTETGCDKEWCDMHFNERVSGKPTNPGEAYKYWPYHKNLDNSEFKGEKFSHTYQERFWPKHAGNYYSVNREVLREPLQGIRFKVGDLNDVIEQLIKNPLTRQAYLPIWFPEDTWAANNQERVPCFPAGTKIQTSQGYKNIEDIKVGDMVFTHRGRLRRVTKTMLSNYTGKLYTIRTKYQEPIKTTNEHPFLINGDWVKAEDIKVGDSWFKAINNKTGVSYINPDIMRLLGYYLAEGDMQFDKRRGRCVPKSIRFNMSTKDLEAGWIDDIVNIIRKHINPNYKPKFSIKRQNIRFQLFNRKFAEFIFDNCGHLAKDKYISDDIMNNPNENLLELFKGWVRGDGGCRLYGKKVSFSGSTTSSKLAQSLDNICNILQIKHSLKIVDKRRETEIYGRKVEFTNINYRFVFYDKNLGLDIFNLTKPNRAWVVKDRDINKVFDGKHQISTIEKIDIEEVENLPVYNLEVEEDHTYNTISGTVHNCTLGYYFYVEDDKLHCNYTIRSCDAYRHFRNDLYLTLRLQEYIAMHTRIIPGSLNFMIYNFHVFKNDMYNLQKKESKIRGYGFNKD